MKVIFFPNGNTIVFEKGKQVPDLQESWFMLYVGMVAAYGLDPTQMEFVMPNATRAEVIETSQGDFNWRISAQQITAPDAVRDLVTSSGFECSQCGAKGLEPCADWCTGNPQ